MSAAHIASCAPGTEEWDWTLSYRFDRRDPQSMRAHIPVRIIGRCTDASGSAETVSCSAGVC